MGALRPRAVPFLRRNFGLIFQDQKLLFDRTAFDNVMLPLAITGFERREAARRVRAALDKVGLLAKEKANPVTLSGGEQQRLAIARAIVHRPAILLADEPTGNLDAAYAAEIGELFRSFNQVGVTVVIATHDEAFAARLKPRLIALKEGRARGMKAWFWHHLRRARARRLRGSRARRSATLLNVGVIGIALALPVGLYVALDNLQGLARTLASDPQLSVFLALDAGRADAEQIEARLKQHPGVREARFVPRDQALKELKASTGLADVVDSLPQNPLPDAFVVLPRDARAAGAGEAARRGAPAGPRSRTCSSTRPGRGGWKRG